MPKKTRIRMKGTRHFFRLLLLIIALLTFFQPTAESAARQVNTKDLEYVLPAASDFVKKIDPFPYYEGYDFPNGSLVGVAFLSIEVVPEESWGYSSLIEILTGVDLKGRITGVTVLAELESPRYTKGLLRDGSWFLTQFENMTSEDLFVLQYDVDAISGATITSSAVTRSIKTGLERITFEVLYRELPPEVRQYSFWYYLMWQIDILLLFCITALAFHAFFKREEWLRYTTLGMVFAYIGILKGGGLSLIDVLRLFSFRMPLFLNNLYWYSLVFIAIGVTLFAGRFYCGWLCPFGAFTEFLYRLVPLKWRPPETLDRCLKLVKFINLIILLILGLILSNTVTAIYITGIVEPFATFFHLDGDLPAWIWLILMLLLSSVVSRFFCRYFCPLGAFFAVLSAIAGFLKLKSLHVTLSGKHSPENCKGCRMAEKQCQMGAIHYDDDLNQPEIDENECFMCNACTAVCPAKSSGSTIQDSASTIQKKDIFQ
ncbi:Putative modular membrane protein involved in electron transport: RnfG-like FMN-binding domain and a polyferredoxin domain containing a 4Fe-4S center [Desulfamplus magnetovallimortis]|uniref:Putative modular membrane protein involved in electron transport: RnfG-like FMN-binding domain and a polyferredoxin domain containing a 4Fe-4S center n=1 Tax=Desulfamplus magnetovallimortis TaxID=1246637 RepID=L0R3X2_9BACT|nr:4Fe-4S binding protein [Desulfamplus magnetovallimortis]CCO06698.1 Putative modular membrane protein involved in electron transport: RnfG-like FMN-binding domain and a polyferredoxin domain containing a 4Fe-4S center [Desulfamplus magnetovallimortis BW-1]SLM32749.1 Putative modular membrane protein involved in electron transport: RnfG-like FMN-binding domain and a polyferredoxin domain containing a 4Fe-4S center [Desulfamplus magnetovallimortis]